MDKIPVVLVVPNVKKLNDVLGALNFNNAKPVAIITETSGNQIGSFSYGNFTAPVAPFTQLKSAIVQARNCVWLIGGCLNGVSDLYKIKKLLAASGVPEDNIVNFEVAPHISPSWIANVRYAEKYPVDFFATGISYTEAGLNFRVIPGGGGYRGINLASSNQDLRQGYLTAKYVFEHAPKGNIKFVLIGLTPYSLRYDNIKSFAVCPRNLQYVWTLNNSQDDSRHGQLLQILVSDNLKAFFMSITAESADLNFEALKNLVNRSLSANEFISWQDELKNLTKDERPETFAQNLQILEDYIKLCLQNGAKPILFMFPFAQAMRENYDKNLLAAFRWTIHTLTEKYKIEFIDMFDLPLDYDCFYNMAHLNWKGSMLSSSLLNVQLHEKNILPFENLCNMSYEQLILLQQILDAGTFKYLVRKIYSTTAAKIRQKPKIKVAFVLYDASMWCGDKIYNLFAQNPRYEVSIFLCLRTDKYNVEKVRENFTHGVQQFKSHGLNVIGIDSLNAEVPKQDVLIFTTPYIEIFPPTLQPSQITAETLNIYIPYGFHMSGDLSTIERPFTQLSHKIFLESRFISEVVSQSYKNMPAEILYSGYSKLDVFFDGNANFHYDWKMAVPNAKKIIWAPHWSINGGVPLATFQWNYQFMYDYAKAHPEISWVVKPHPNLLYSAVESGLFKTPEEFKAYFQAWDDLPNAKVETGAYYQAIFATSDGMIHDSGSFILEYQYTHKPMIFLTRENKKFNDLVENLMNVTYKVDGRDLSVIAALMEKVFIRGEDELFEARKKFFDENLNYVKENGMTASEFIFKKITEEFD